MKAVPLWRNYEYYVIRHHAMTHKHTTWHWSYVPEYHAIRANCCNKLIKNYEYGLDGLAWNALNDTYMGIQAKCNMESRLSARSLGTFFHVHMRMQWKFKQTCSYVYHAGELTKELEKDLDILKDNGIFFVQLMLHK